MNKFNIDKNFESIYYFEIEFFLYYIFLYIVYFIYYIYFYILKLQVICYVYVSIHISLLSNFININVLMNNFQF